MKIVDKLDPEKPFLNIIAPPDQVPDVKGWLSGHGYEIEFEETITYPPGTLLNTHEGKVNIGAKKSNLP